MWTNRAILTYRVYRLYDTMAAQAFLPVWGLLRLAPIISGVNDRTLYIQGLKINPLYSEIPSMRTCENTILSGVFV